MIPTRYNLHVWKSRYENCSCIFVDKSAGLCDPLSYLAFHLCIVKRFSVFIDLFEYFWACKALFWLVPVGTSAILHQDLCKIELQR